MILVTFDLDGVLMHNPFGTYVFPMLAAQLSPYIRSNDQLTFPTDEHGNPISPLPEQIRIPGLDDKGRTVIAAIFAESALQIYSKNLGAAYDWDAAAINVARKLGCSCSEQIDVTQLVNDGCKLGHVSAYPNAVKTLQTLKKMDARLVALSNGFTRYQAPVLKTLGLFDYFDAIVSPEETGVAKPLPALFAAARAAVRVEENTPACHIGDSVVCDIAGAHSAGFRALWVHAGLSTAVAGCTPIERPSHPELLAQLRKEAEREFASGAYQIVPEQLVPDAVVAGMAEVPDTILYLYPDNRLHKAI